MEINEKELEMTEDNYKDPSKDVPLILMKAAQRLNSFEPFKTPYFWEFEYKKRIIYRYDEQNEAFVYSTKESIL